MQADCAFRVSAGSFTAPTSDVEPGSDCDGGILRVPWDNVLYPRRGSRPVPDKVPLGSLDVTAAESIGAQLSLSFSTSHLCFSLLQLPLLARARAPIDWSEVERRVGVERSRGRGREVSLSSTPVDRFAQARAAAVRSRSNKQSC